MTARTTCPPACKSPPNCTASSKTRCCPAPASTAPAFWQGLRRDRPRPRAEERRAAGRARPPAGRAGPLAQGPPGPDRATWRPTAASCERSATWCRRPTGREGDAPTNVDAELALQAGPQLVVPILNARYALNAANARWGSLYDALYGTDAIPETGGAEKGGATTRCAAPRSSRSRATCSTRPRRWRTARTRTPPATSVERRQARRHAARRQRHAAWRTRRSSSATRATRQRRRRCCCSTTACTSTSRSTAARAIGKTDAAGVSDLVMEAALSTILDLEDSVAVVDAEDKVLAYRNWLGILQGTLTEEVTKGGKTFTRGLNPDRVYTGAERQGAVTLHGRSLLFVRNVGHLMTNPAILLRRRQGDPGRHPGRGGHDDDRAARPASARPDGIGNSRTGSIYIVKPKMHGPAEVAFASELFGRVEAPARPAGQHRQARHHGRGAPHQRQPQGLHRGSGRAGRVHQHRLPRPHRRRDAHRHASRPDAAQGRHEDQRLDRRLRAQQRAGRPGLRPARPRADRQGHVGHARPDGRDARTEDRAPQGRRQHRLGAVADRRDAARAALPPGRRVRRCRRSWKRSTPTPSATTCSTACCTCRSRRSAELDAPPRCQQELDNNAQGILGYVVRWIDQGVGCSKVPDIHNVGLMEDRATLRISSQHIANWLLHGVVTQGAGRRDLRSAWPRWSTSRTPATRCTGRWRGNFEHVGCLPGRAATWCSRASSSRTATPSRCCMRGG